MGVIVDCEGEGGVVGFFGGGCDCDGVVLVLFVEDDGGGWNEIGVG